jgi:hypothetical protein
VSSKKEIMPLKKSGIKASASSKAEKKVEKDKSVIGSSKTKNSGNENVGGTMGMPMKSKMSKK